MKAKLYEVKVYPKDLKSIPDILPFRQLIHGEPVELELDKKEICRCMNFGDVFDLTSGEEVLIDENSFKELVEFVEDEEVSEEDPESGNEEVPEVTPDPEEVEPEEVPEEDPEIPVE